jgi:hypothetical protein
MKSFKKYFPFGLVLVFLFTFLPCAFTSAQVVEKDILLVFDASGSMSEQFGGSPRIDVLKSSVSDLLNTLDSSVFVGLRPFANIKNPDQVQACKITSLAQNFTTERSIIKTQTSLLQAVGSYTPLAYTLTVSGGDFKVGNDNVLILLTDGKDTCGGDPVKAAGDLFNSDKKVKIYVIGMGVDADAKAQLSAISTAGGGIYYDASDSTSLASSFKAIQNLEKPIDRTNNDALLGTPVRGGTGFDNALLLTPGRYRLDHNLNADQYDYFKVNVKKGDKLNVKIITGDKEVRYDEKTNSFFVDSLRYNDPWYRISFLDSDRVILTYIYVRGVSQREEKTLDIEYDDVLYLKVGNDSWPTDKYSAFTIKLNDEPTTAPVTNTGVTQNTNSATNGSSGTQNTNNTNSAPNNTNAGTNGESKDSSSSNTIMYVLIGVVVLFIIIIVILVLILLKKKNNPSNNFPPTNNIPPPPAI